MATLEAQSLQEQRPSRAAGTCPDLGDPVTVSLERWRSERRTLTGQASPVGILVPAGEHPDLSESDLRHIRLIVLEFATFTDGRPFSSARILRRLGYCGELRAAGPVLPDQIPLLRRCGFDSLEGDGGKAEPLSDQRIFAVPYQKSGDGVSPAWAHRNRLTGAKRRASA